MNDVYAQPPNGDYNYYDAPYPYAAPTAGPQDYDSYSSKSSKRRNYSNAPYDNSSTSSNYPPQAPEYGRDYRDAPYNSGSYPPNYYGNEYPPQEYGYYGRDSYHSSHHSGKSHSSSSSRQKGKYYNEDNRSPNTPRSTSVSKSKETTNGNGSSSTVPSMDDGVVRQMEAELVRLDEDLRNLKEQQQDGNLDLETRNHIQRLEEDLQKEITSLQQEITKYKH